MKCDSCVYTQLNQVIVTADVPSVHVQASVQMKVKRHLKNKKKIVVLKSSGAYISFDIVIFFIITRYWLDKKLCTKLLVNTTLLPVSLFYKFATDTV